MRKNNIFAFIFALAAAVSAQQIEVVPDISQVKVYFSGAEIVHKSSVNLNGTSEILFSGLAENIDPNSISVKAPGVTILSISKRLNYIKPVSEDKTSQRIKTIIDSLTTIKEIKELEVSSLSDKLNFLNALSSNGKLSFNDIKKLADYYNKQSDIIRRELFNKKKEISFLSKQIKKHKQQLDEYRKKSKYVNEIIVNISPAKTESAEFTIRYLTYNAHWNPEYDFRSDGFGENPKLILKASVRQNTGLSWGNAEVIFSSRILRQNNVKPELSTWFIDFYKSGSIYKTQMYRRESAMAAKAEAVEKYEYSELNENQFAFEFTPNSVPTIPPDNKKHFVILKKYQPKADYRYFVVPKLDNNAFLIAELTDWEKLRLMPGSVNVFFESAYVGKSFINPNSTNKILKISLGRDNGIIVKRTLLKDFTDEKILSSNVERTFEIEIELKNNKRKSVEISVEENIPISKQEEITVKALNLAGSKYNKETGNLLWKVSLLPGEQKRIRYSFSVLYPGDKALIGI